MKVMVRYDRAADAYTLTGEDVILRTPEDVAEWNRQLVAEMQSKLGNRRGYFLIDLASFIVDPVVAEEYGKVQREIAGRFALGAVRYGQPPQSNTLTQVRLQNVINNTRANICKSREEALLALEKLRSVEQPVSSGDSSADTSRVGRP